MSSSCLVSDCENQDNPSPKETLPKDLLFGEDDDMSLEGGPDLGDIDSPMSEPKVKEKKCIYTEIPYLPVNLGSEVHLVKLPNFLSIEPRPFDPETYIDEIDEEEVTDEEGRKRLKLKVTNTIRWREVKDESGNIVRESNTRIVKWSDGSLTLHLGKEVFDVYPQPLQGENTHIFVRHGNCLKGHTDFRSKLIFRPHSTDSSTHRRITRSMADRTQRTFGTKVVTQVGRDPDVDRQSLLKLEREKLREDGRKRAPPKLKKRRPPKDYSMSRAFGKSSLDVIAEESEFDGEDFDIGVRRRASSERAKSRKALSDSDDSD